MLSIVSMVNVIRVSILVLIMSFAEEKKENVHKFDLRISEVVTESGLFNKRRLETVNCYLNRLQQSFGEEVNAAKRKVMPCQLSFAFSSLPFDN